MTSKKHTHRTISSYFKCCMAWIFGWILLSGSPGASGAEIYVATNAAPTAPFSSWETGFNNLQDAFDHASDGDTIRLAGQPFAGGPAAGESYVFCLTNKTNLTVIGGYEAASETPGDRDPDQWPTVLKRDSGEAGVLHLIGVSNVVFRGITIRDGLVPETFAKGGGVYLSESLDVVFDDCRVIENVIPVGTAYSGRPASYGGGFYLQESTVTITNSIVSDNKNLGSDSTFNTGSRYGGAVYIDGNSRMQAFDSVFTDNEAGNRGNHNRGGGFYIANGGVLDLRRSEIRGNRIIGGHYGSASGAGFYIENGGEVEVRQSVIAENETDEYVAVGVFHTPTRGGGFYNEAGAILLLMESVIASNRAALSRGGFGGGIYNLGAAHLRNVLIAGNVTSTRGPVEASDGIWTGGAAALMLLENCTVVDNHRDVPTAVGIRYDGGAFSMTNSIVWGHAHDLLGFTPDSSGRLPQIWYSNIGGGWNAGFQGCHSTDPRFADDSWYHLQSTEGHYSGGFFDGGEWTVAASNSPLIARGNPSSAFDREPAPNGNRINIGAYGNTDVAALLAADIDPPSVEASGATARAKSAAILRGTILDDGGFAPVVTIEYWLAGDSTTNTVSPGIQTNAFEQGVFGLTPDSSYHYRVHAVNPAGTNYSGSLSFDTLPAATTNLFVSNEGDGSDGTSWATAYTNLNWAFTVLSSGDTLHLAGQPFAGQGTAVFGEHYVFRLADAVNITVMGGYQASNALPPGEHPGPRDPGQWPTILERASGYGSVLHVISISNGVMRGVTFRGGLVSPWFRKGGGVFVSESTELVFQGCHIVESQVFGSMAYGGGLYLQDSSVTLQECRVAGNESSQPAKSGATEFNLWQRAFGGGAAVDASSRLVLQDTSIETNRVHSGALIAGGGGVHVAGELEMRNVQVQGNLAGQDHYGYVHGGGLFIAGGGSAFVRNSIIKNNVNDEHPDRLSVKRRATYGAGVYIEAGGAADLGETEVIGNIANGGTTSPGDSGGAIYNLGVLRLRNTLIVSNKTAIMTTDTHGGAVWSGGNANTLIESSTLANNATVAGIHYDAGAIALTNTIVWGHDEDLRNLPADNGILLNVSHSLFGAPAEMHEINGCMTNHPVFVDATDGNYRLERGSPATDTGINLPWMIGAVDLDGNPRIMPGIATVQARVDIGAYEIVPPRGTFFLIR